MSHDRARQQSERQLDSVRAKTQRGAAGRRGRRRRLVRAVACLSGWFLLPAGCDRDPDARRAVLQAPPAGHFADPTALSCWKEPGSWPQFMHDPLHTGRADVDFPRERLQPAWEFRPSEHVYSYREGMSVWSSPVAGTVQGRPLVIAGYCDRNVYAVDAVTGGKVWEFSPGGHVFAAPALADLPGGPLVILAATNRTVFGVDAATGQRRWTFQTADWTFTQAPSFMSSPTVVALDGVPTVFVGVWISDRSATRNVQSGELAAIRADDGSPIWRKRLASVPVTSPVVARMGTVPVVFVATHHGVVDAVSAANGELLWESPLNEGLRSSVSMGLAGGTWSLFVGTRQHTLFALDPTTGARRWRAPANYWLDATPGLVFGNDVNVVVAGSYDRNVYAWSAGDGKPVWTTLTGNYAYSSPAIASMKGRLSVFQMSWDQGLYVLDGASGRVIWKTFSGPLMWSHAFQGDSLWASPAVTRVGGKPLVLFPACDGRLYAFF